MSPIRVMGCMAMHPAISEIITILVSFRRRHYHTFKHHYPDSAESHLRSYFLQLV